MKKAVAMMWLVVGGSFTVGAAMKVVLMLLGLYDPVTHDGLPKESYPWYMLRLIGIPVLFLATARTAFRMLNAKPR